MSKTTLSFSVDRTLAQALRELARKTGKRLSDIAGRALGNELRRLRLSQACERLKPAEERARAEEGLGKDSRSWPPY